MLHLNDSDKKEHLKLFLGMFDDIRQDLPHSFYEQMIVEFEITSSNIQYWLSNDGMKQFVNSYAKYLAIAYLTLLRNCDESLRISLL